MPFLAGGSREAPPPGETPAAEAGQVFEQMARAINQITNYEAEWAHFVTTTGPRPIWVRTVAEGKFVRSPRRVTGFVEGVSAAVSNKEYTRLVVNPGLKPQDIKFEGLAMWSFPAEFVANSKGLETLRFQPLPAAAGTAPDFPRLLANFGAALNRLQDYRAEFTLSQKYFRLRSRGRAILSVIREPRFFLFEFDPDLRINYLHLMSAGGKVCYRRAEHSYAAMGGGAMRAAGIELMSVEDHRADFPCGESFYTMNFFELFKRMQWYGAKGKVTADLVSLAGKACPRAVMKRTADPRPGEVQDMNVIFSPQTWLPLRIEYPGEPGPPGLHPPGVPEREDKSGIEGSGAEVLRRGFHGTTRPVRRGFRLSRRDVPARNREGENTCPRECSTKRRAGSPPCWNCPPPGLSPWTAGEPRRLDERSGIVLFP